MFRALVKALFSLIAAVPIVLPTFALAPGDLAPQVVPLAAKQGGSEFSGQLIYVDFWASWCGPCKESLTWLNELQNKYGTKGLRVVAINVDTDHSAAIEALKEVDPKFEVVFDPQGEIAKRYAIKGMPSSFLIDGGGKILEVHNGFSESDKADREKTLRKILDKRQEI